MRNTSTAKVVMSFHAAYNYYVYLQSTDRTPVSELCSQDYTCRLKSGTRSRIETRIGNGGSSFDECQQICRSSVRGKKAKHCTCYCFSVHDPCSAGEFIDQQICIRYI